MLLPDYISVWRELANCEHEPGDANEDDLLNTAGLEFMIRMLIQVEICWSRIEIGQLRGGLIAIRTWILKDYRSGDESYIMFKIVQVRFIT